MNKDTPLLHWEQLRVEANTFTQSSLDMIKEQSGIPYQTTIGRKFLTRTLAGFIQSSATAVMLSAPSGYGKSIMMARWIEEETVHSQDIIWMLRADSMQQTIQKEASIEQILYQSKDIFAQLNFFEQHPKEREGHIFLFIDDFALASIKGKETIQLYEKILAFIHAVSKYAWFKIVVFVQVPIEEQIIYLMRNKPHQQNLWFYLPRVSEGRGGNIPLLNEEEIHEIIARYDEYQAGKSKRQEDFLKLTFHMQGLLRIPYYLQIFLNMQQEATSIYNELTLLQYVLQHILSRGLYQKEKVAIVDSFLEHMMLQPGLGYVDKKRLKKGMEYFEEAYEVLLKEGILKEVQQHVNIFKTRTQVYFLHPQLLALLLVQHYCEKNGKIDMAIANTICQHFHESSLLTELFLCCILMAFEQEAYDFLQNVFQINYPFQDHEYTHHMIFPLIMALGTQMRLHEKARDILFESYAKSSLGRSLYYEFFVDCDYLVAHHYKGMMLYRENTKTPEGQLFSTCLLFLKSFLAMEEESCTHYYQEINKIPYNLAIHPIPLARKLAYTILYQHYYEDGIEASTFMLIDSLKERVPRAGNLSKYIPFFHIYVAEALNWCGYHEIAENLIAEAFADYTLSNNYSDQPTLNRLHQQKAWACSQTGNKEAAHHAFYQVKPYYFDAFTRQFDLMNYYLAEANLWKMENDTDIAVLCLEKARQIAEKHQFYFFSQRLIPDLMKQ